MNINAYEVFEQFEAAETKEDKRNVLLKNANSTIMELLTLAFHPDIKFAITKAPKDYRPNISPVGLAETTLNQEIKKAYLFMESHPKLSPNLTLEKRNILLMQLLEAMEAKEADMYLRMLSKNLKVKGLTYKFVKEVFPNLLP